MNRGSKLRLSVVLTALVMPAHAAIEVTFIEDAPKDRFVITNTGDCAAEDLEIVIDLGPSAAGLYFDTTAAGAGVQVFQPFEVARGSVQLRPEAGKQDAVEDGQKVLTVQVSHLAAGDPAEFTIDVDDTVRDGALGQTRVATSEISGARVQLVQRGRAPLEAHFDATGKVMLAPLTCRGG